MHKSAFDWPQLFSWRACHNAKLYWWKGASQTLFEHNFRTSSHRPYALEITMYAGRFNVHITQGFVCRVLSSIKEPRLSVYFVCRKFIWWHKNLVVSRKRVNCLANWTPEQYSGHSIAEAPNRNNERIQYLGLGVVNHWFLIFLIWMIDYTSTGWKKSLDLITSKRSRSLLIYSFAVYDFTLLHKLVWYLRRYKLV